MTISCAPKCCRKPAPISVCRLPSTRCNSRSFGVDYTPAELERMAHQSFTEIQAQMSDLAAKGREATRLPCLGLPLRHPRAQTGTTQERRHPASLSEPSRPDRRHPPQGTPDHAPRPARHHQNRQRRRNRPAARAPHGPAAAPQQSRRARRVSCCPSKPRARAAKP